MTHIAGIDQVARRGGDIEVHVHCAGLDYLQPGVVVYTKQQRNLPMNKHVVCLYEESGFSAEEWAVNGYDVFCYDILHTEERVEIAGTGRKIFVPWDATDPAQNDALYARHAGHAAIVLAYPPCTDLAVLGAAWFASKKAANPNYRDRKSTRLNSSHLHLSRMPSSA